MASKRISISFVGLDDPDVEPGRRRQLHGIPRSLVTAKRLLLPAFFFETRAHPPFVNQEKRTGACRFMHYGEVITDQVTYHLPPVSPSRARLRTPGRWSWPEHAALATKAVTGPGTITIARTIARAFTLAKPEEYQDLRGFYQKVAASDQQQLVLTTGSAAKGN